MGDKSFGLLAVSKTQRFLSRFPFFRNHTSDLYDFYVTGLVYNIVFRLEVGDDVGQGYEPVTYNKRDKTKQNKKVWVGLSLGWSSVYTKGLINILYETKINRKEVQGVLETETLACGLGREKSDNPKG